MRIQTYIVLETWLVVACYSLKYSRSAPHFTWMFSICMKSPALRVSSCHSLTEAQKSWAIGLLMPRAWVPLVSWSQTWNRHIAGLVSVYACESWVPKDWNTQDTFTPPRAQKLTKDSDWSPQHRFQQQCIAFRTSSLLKHAGCLFVCLNLAGNFRDTEQPSPAFFP